MESGHVQRLPLDPPQSDSDKAGVVPRESAGLQIAVWGLFVLVLISVLQSSREVFFPLALAVLLYFVLNPLVQNLKRLGIPSSLGAAVVLLTVGAACALAIVELSGPAAHWMGQVPEGIEEIRSTMGEMRQTLSELSKAEELLVGAVKDSQADTLMVEMRPQTILETVFSMGGKALLFLLSAFVLLYFLLATGDTLLEHCVEIAPRLSDKKKVVGLARKIQKNISGYLLTVTILNVVLGIVMGCVLWLMQLPNPALWGAMACVLNTIPYVGVVLGSAVVFIVALFAFNDASVAVIYPAVYFSINSIEGTFITPAALGKRLNINPVVMLTWLFLWLWLWGIPGGLLAVPMLSILMISFDAVDKLRPLARLMAGSNDPIEHGE